MASSSMAPMESVGITRRSGSFPPSAWENHLKMSSYDDVRVAGTNNKEHEKLKAEINRLLQMTAMPLDKIELVDCLQQLGIRYHFEEETKKVLETIYVEVNNVFSACEDMYSTALLFKVLRENGFEVSQDVFRKFLCSKTGLLSEDHEDDTKGLLILYEASFLGFHEEKILDMARLFASNHLKKHCESLMIAPELQQKVRHVLQIPTYWRLTRVQAQWSIKFNDKTTMNPIVLEFAKLDYNMVQELHKAEIGEITRWWDDLSLRKELNFARDRIVESYIWTMGVFFQPKYRDHRKYMTQAICLLTIIDDMYDVYGSINELELFTKVIEKWDVNSIEELPKYMKICFLALFNMVNVSSYHIFKEKDIFVVPYIKKLWQDLCKAYLLEAKWYHNKHIPLLEEYIRNGIISSGVQLAVSYSYIFSSQNISKKELSILQKTHDLINWSGIVFRLNNDISTSDRELKRGDVMKAVECYKHEQNISTMEAELHIKGIILDTWKRINKERTTTSIQKELVDICIDICRASQCFYKNGDEYGSPAKDQVVSLLFDSV